MRHLFPLLLLLFGSLNAATYYVNDSTGLDSRTTTQAQSPSTPWKTINKAASTIPGGSTVIVAAGTYKEHVVIPSTASGVGGAPTIFQGAGGGASWPTIIDPSDPLNTGWVIATDITGASTYGGYKQVLPMIPGCLTVNGKMVMNKKIARKPWIGFAPNATATFADVGFNGSYPVFDGKEAITVWDASTSTCYFRERNGLNPNTADTRVSYNDGITTNLGTKNAVRILGNWVTVRGFEIRGTRNPVIVAGNPSHFCVIESNYVHNGYTQIIISPQASKQAATNIIRYNFLSPDYFFNEGGPYYAKTHPETFPQVQIYITSKNHDSGSGLDSSKMILLANCGNGNVIHDNYMTNGSQGMQIYAAGFALSSAPIRGTIIASNHIWNTSSVGFVTTEGTADTYFFRNDIRNSNQPERHMALNATLGHVRTYYSYGNTIWNPPNLGKWIEMSSASATATGTNVVMWWYHNTYAGGRSVIEVHGDLKKGPGFMMLNNLFYSLPGAVDSSLSGVFALLNPTIRGSSLNWGAFENNAVRADVDSEITAPAWSSIPSNKRLPTFTWTTPQDFYNLPDEHPALGMALNVGSSFTMRSQSWPALPGGSTFESVDPVRAAGAWQRGNPIEGDPDPDPDPATMFMSIEADGPHAFEAGLVPQTFTVTRTESISGAVTVNYTVGGTATSGVHYEALSGSVSFADQQSTATITLTPLLFDDFTGNLTVTVQLSVSLDYTLKDPKLATITIIDANSPPPTNLRVQPEIGQVTKGRR